MGRGFLSPALAKSLNSVDNGLMALSKRIACSGGLEENWGAALKESGLEYLTVRSMADALNADVSCFLIDARKPEWVRDLAELKKKKEVPILSLVDDRIGVADLQKLRSSGSQGYLSEKLPVEEVIVRIRALMDQGNQANKETRSARRVWFQQEVSFKVFDRNHKAWSTTLSETGIFLHTTLTFPLYTVLHLEFNLLGQAQPFSCEGVIVRQEVEGPIPGLGIMFQNLKGENVRILESFLELYK